MRANTQKRSTYSFAAERFLIVGTILMVVAGCNRDSTDAKKGSGVSKKEPTVALKLLTKKMEINIKIAEHLEKGEKAEIPPLRKQLEELEIELNGLPMEEKLEAQRTIKTEWDAATERLQKAQGKNVK